MIILKKFKQYLVFTKFRLAALVVLSALSGYLFVGGTHAHEIWLLLVGGLLVTAASNGTNQIIERDLDTLMKRTAKRPLASREMSVNEGIIIVALCLAIGTFMLHQLNFKSALLGLIAFGSYSFIYTPLKRITPWAVFVGAFPGAIPPMLGAIAFTDKFDLVPGILFFVQFIWQFPHFWAIAWVAHDDYQKAGFHLLPSRSGKGKASAYQIMVYSLAMIPFSLLPWIMGWVGSYSMLIATILGAVFYFLSFRLYHSCDDKDARKLMFASFIYLPIIQFVYVFDRIEPAISQYLNLK